MSLFWPGTLALLAVPLIVLLHLIRQRHRKARVPALTLWQQLAPPPERRARMLPLTWLLLLHVLAALCLGLALAQPQLNPLGIQSPTHTILIIDRSSSMAAQDVAPSRFAQAQQAAFQVIDSLAAEDSLALVSLDAMPQLIGTGDAVDRERLRSLVAGLAPAGNGSDLQRALELAQSLLEPDKQNRILILSDQAFPSPQQALTTGAPTAWRTWGGAAPNLAITTFAARRLPSGAVSVYARVSSFEMPPLATEVALQVDGTLFSEQTVQVPLNGSHELVWEVPASAEQLELFLASDDALPADDQAFLPLNQAQNLRVRIITPDSESSVALERVLSALPGLSVTVAAQDDPQNPVDVVVLNGVLPDPFPSGALLIIDPPPGDPRLPVLSNLVQERASSAALDGAFALVDLSSVQWQGRHPLGPLPPALRPVIRDLNGAPLVVQGAFNGQPTVIWAFDPAASNLPARLAFPLLSAASIDVLTGGALPATLPPGSPNPAPNMLGPDGSSVPGRLDQPGWYRFTDQPGRISVNFGDPLESQLVPQPQPTFDLQPYATNVAIQPPQRMQLWPWLVALALLVITLEWWYVYRWSAA